MAAVQCPFPGIDDPRGAVAAACARQGVAPDHVEIEPLDPDPMGTTAWRWHLTADAPLVELRDVWVFETVVDRRGRHRPTGRAHHPKLTAGVVFEVNNEWIVVADDDGGGEAVENLIAAGLEEAHAAGRSRS